MSDDDISGYDARMIAAEELVMPIPCAGLAFWREACGSAFMPPVSAINPFALRKMLPNVVVFGVIWPEPGLPDMQPDDFEYRLVGERAAELLGKNLQGKRFTALTEFPGNYAGRMLNFYRLICATGQPQAASGKLNMIGKEYLEFEAVYLPFCGDGGRVDRILAVVS